MKPTLYPNMKKMTSIFFAGIVSITVATLSLRLTIFNSMATAASPAGETLVSTDTDTAYGEVFTYQINKEITFSDPAAQGNLLIHNPDTNKYMMTVDIVLADTGRSLVYTGLIKPGVSYNSAAMSSPQLEKGVYNCIAQICTRDPETLEPNGWLEVDVKVYVGEKP